MDVGLGESYSADGALAVPVSQQIVDALLAEDMRTGVVHHLALAFGPAAAHDLVLELLQLQLEHLVLSLLLDGFQLEAQLVDLHVLLLLVLDHLLQALLLLLDQLRQLPDLPLPLLHHQLHLRQRLPLSLRELLQLSIHLDLLFLHQLHLGLDLLEMLHPLLQLPLHLHLGLQPNVEEVLVPLRLDFELVVLL